MATLALWRPTVTTGVGLGGLVDGILLHQVLQLHHLLSSSGQDRLGLAAYPPSTVAGLEVNVLWDGLFHVVAYLFVLVGVLQLWPALRGVAPGRAPRRMLLGGLLFGWGVFNVVEGLVDHHLLRIHHVAPGELELVWDLLFLAAGAGLMAGGWALRRSAVARSATAGDDREQLPR